MILLLKEEREEYHYHGALRPMVVDLYMLTTPFHGRLLFPVGTSLSATS